jgi:Methyltransferase domain
METTMSSDTQDRWRDRLYKIRHEPGALRRLLARRFFDLFQALGFHVTADHFYEVIPNTRELKRTYKQGRRDCLGIDFQYEQSQALCANILGTYGAELYKSGLRFGYYEDNAYFRGVDALALYCFVREFKPNRVIEIGQGFSTRVTLAALHENASTSNQKPSFLSIDPYSRFAPKSEVVRFEVKNESLQAAMPFVLNQLSEGDLLFVDSSHVHKSGSDVELFYDAIYPRLPNGVMVHIHDIFSPFDYPLSWAVQSKRFWNEQYHLENFLRFNSEFQVVLPLHLLMRESDTIKALAESLIQGTGHLLLGQSIYLRRR